MRKLLSANFARLWRNKAFCISMVVAGIGSMYFSYLNYHNISVRGEEGVFVEDVMFNIFPMIGFLCAAFISMLLGTEFDNGTIRNKLVVGHTRTQVFFAHLIVCTVASIMLLVAMLLCAGIPGYLFFKEFMLGWQEQVFILVCCILVTMVYSGLCTSLAMSVSDRAYALGLSLAVLLAMTFGASFANSRLNEPEMTYTYAEITMNGIQFGDMVENPAYIDGAQRTVYEYICDILPTGQAEQICNLEFDRCARWPWLSVLVLVVTISVGWLMFKKKDIK